MGRRGGTIDGHTTDRRHMWRADGWMKDEGIRQMWRAMDGWAKDGLTTDEWTIDGWTKVG